MFYGYYGFTPVSEQENKYESRLIFRVFETEEERGKELSNLRNRWNGDFTPFIFTKEVCEKLNIKTVDDCIQNIPNRFQMTLAATYRARQITAGATPMVEIDRDKPTVLALRELAQGLYGLEMLNRGQS